MRSNAFCLILSFSITVGLTGCARYTAESSVVDHAPTADMELDFWEGIESARVVTNNDALHGLLLLTDGTDSADTFEGRVDSARSKGWVSRNWSAPPNESATVGMMAVAACQIMDVRGGITMMIFGPSERYCARELVAMGFIPQRSQNQSLSGLEFSDLVRRIERRSPAPTSAPSQPQSQQNSAESTTETSPNSRTLPESVAPNELPEDGAD